MEIFVTDGRQDSDFVTIPILETPRLFLRRHELRDLELCAEMWAHPEVVKHTIQTPSPYQRTYLRLLSYVGHWQLHGFGYWAVEEKSSAKYIGDLGFADFKRGLGPKIDLFPEAGWALSPSVHNKGFATEALRAALDWGDKHLKSKRTVCIISPENSASIRLAQKVGYKELNRGFKDGVPEIFFARE